jgi:rifampicin phosphotransferase
MSDGPLVIGPEDALSADRLEAAALVGGKALSLARIRQTGLETPRGFVLTTSACRAFLSNGGRWLEGLRTDVDRALDELERSIGRPLGKCENSLTVAVRSGAPVSMPGTMATILHRGSRPEIFSAIEQVFRSWMSVQAREFRRLNGIDDSLGTAVIVQEMIPTRVAGVLFTTDPQRKDSDEMIVEAVEGLGDSLVSGRSTPARWLLRKSSLEVIETVNCPSDSATGQFERRQLVELCHQAQRLRDAWNDELDIEWGEADGRLVMFQARPIPRTSDLTTEQALCRVVEDLRIRAGETRRVWVRHNLNESLPNPTPLTWSILQPFMSGSGGFGKVYRRLGYAPTRRACDEGFLELIGGRVYADLERQLGMYCDGFPLGFDVVAIRRDPGRLERVPTTFRPENTDPLLLFRLPGIAAILFRVWRSRKHLLKAAGGDFQRTEIRIRDYVIEERRIDLTSLSDERLLDLLDSRRRRVLDEFAPDLLLPGALGAAEYAAFESRLEGLLGTLDGTRLARELIATIPNPTLERQQSLLREATSSSGAFLAEYGHRAIGEMELSVPRWKETPDLIEQWASRDDRTLRDRTAKSGDSLSAALCVLDKRLKEAGASSLSPPLAKTLGQVCELLPLRETGRHVFLLGYALLRDITEELVRRWGLGNRLYFLRVGELRGFRRTSESDAWLMRRFDEWRNARTISLPAVIESDQLGDLVRPVNVARGARVEAGTRLSPGRARGNVQILGHEAFTDRGGEILVCESIDPAALPVLARAAGIIAEQGGQLSHGAVVARQLRIPAIVLPDARRILKSGDEVLLDGDEGIVSIGERPA